MLIKLQNCTPEFVRECFPERSGNIFIDQEQRTAFFLFKNIVCFSTMSKSARPTYSVSLTSKKRSMFWFRESGLRYAQFRLDSDGRVHGEKKSWHSNGTLFSLANFYHGKLESSKLWWPDGTPKGFELFRKRGEGDILVNWGKSGELTFVQIKSRGEWFPGPPPPPFCAEVFKEMSEEIKWENQKKAI